MSSSVVVVVGCWLLSLLLVVGCCWLFLCLLLAVGVRYECCSC